MSIFRFRRFQRLLWRVRRPVLALGGGGARGFAHLGVLQVLDEQRLPVRAIAGTSMGAVVGAMYLAYGSASDAIVRWRQAIEAELIPPVRPLRNRFDQGSQEHPLLQVARRVKNNIVVAFAVNRTTVLDDEDLVRAFEFLVPDLAVEELRCPFFAVATDLESGIETRLGSGDLRQVLKASSSIPGLLPSVEVDGKILVDGGVVAEVPVKAARQLGWPVVAVDVSMDIPPLSEDDLVLDTMSRTQLMTLNLLRHEELKHADDIMRPDVGHLTWADWDRFDELVAAGRTAAEEFLGIDSA